MDLIKRTADVISGNHDTEHLYTIPNFPVFMGCVDNEQSNDLHVDSIWEISKSTGMIQLKELIPLNILYAESHGSGDVGKIWDHHHKSFASFISSYNPESVLEIGGGHGRLAKLYESHGDIPWTIIEPNPTPVPNSNAKWIKGFFDQDFISNDCYDCIVHSHVFEHLYEPITFMEDISSFMSNGEKLIFTLPNMHEMLKRKYTNCLNFEHTYFITEPYIEYLLGRYGFKILEKKYFLEDHSIFYAAEKISGTLELTLSNDLYQLNKDVFLNFIEEHETMIDNYNTKLNEIRNPVFLFGAHIFAQFLINMGLDTSKIISILDNDLNKQGKRLYGSNLKVESPKVLGKANKPYVILKAGVYNDEIKKDILNNINPEAIFI